VPGGAGAGGLGADGVGEGGVGVGAVAGAGAVGGAGVGAGAGPAEGAGAGCGLLGDGGIASFVTGGSWGGGGEMTLLSWAHPASPAAMKTMAPSSPLIRTQKPLSPIEICAVRGLVLSHGQSDAHGCPPADLGGYVDATVVELHDTIDQGKPDAAAILLRRIV
jgi:hypothetical protein